MNEKDFNDMIHPLKEEEPRYARRHLNEVIKALKHFENKNGAPRLKPWYPLINPALLGIYPPFPRKATSPHSFSLKLPDETSAVLTSSQALKESKHEAETLGFSNSSTGRPVVFCEGG